MRPLLPKNTEEEAALIARASTPEPAKRKRHQVSIACDNCRKRKIKCDSQRPACSPCLQSGTECHFASPEDTPQRDAILLQLRQMSQERNHLRKILDFLRHSSREESDKLLSTIRAAPSIDHFLETFADASLLVLVDAPQTSTQ